MIHAIGVICMWIVIVALCGSVVIFGIGCKLAWNRRRITRPMRYRPMQRLM